MVQSALKSMGTIPFSPQLVFGRVVRFQYTRYNQKTVGLQVWSLSLNTYFNLNKVNLFTLFKSTLLEVESFTSHQYFPSSPQPWFVLERRRMWLLHSVVYKYVAWHKKWESYEFEWLVNYPRKGPVNLLFCPLQRDVLLIHRISFVKYLIQVQS